jgi:hypothetical protein
MPYSGRNAWYERPYFICLAVIIYIYIYNNNNNNKYAYDITLNSGKQTIKMKKIKIHHIVCDCLHFKSDPPQVTFPNGAQDHRSPTHQWFVKCQLIILLKYFGYKEMT